jgi:hypothetical protein
MGERARFKAAPLKGRIEARIVAVPDDAHVTLAMPDGNEMTLALDDISDATLMVDWNTVGKRPR